MKPGVLFGRRKKGPILQGALPVRRTAARRSRTFDKEEPFTSHGRCLPSKIKNAVCQNSSPNSSTKKTEPNGPGPQSTAAT